MSGLAGIVRRNIVLVVCIPTIVAIHWGWYRLQYNPKFVAQEGDIKVIGMSVGKRDGGN